jgi:hypothetical protein
MQLVGHAPAPPAEVLEVEADRATWWRARLAFWLIRIAARLVRFKLRVVVEEESA